MFTVDRKVTYSDVAGDGYADIAAIADYFQDCSCFHADSVGGGGFELQEQYGCAWLLAGWQIVVNRYPLYGEELRIGTHPIGFDRVMAQRDFMLYDSRGDKIAAASSHWFLLDTRTGAPLRIRDEVKNSYELGDRQEDLAYAPRKVDARGIDVPAEPFKVERYCIDTNRHMNNVWYLRHAMKYLPEGCHPRQVRAEYRKAAVQGDMIYPYLDRQEDQLRVLLADEAKDVYAVIEFA